MVNHPNRGKTIRPGRNPRPDEIQAARKQAGLTQTQASALIYSNWRAWQRWEHGDVRMHPALWELWRYKALGEAIPAEPWTPPPDDPEPAQAPPGAAHDDGGG